MGNEALGRFVVLMGVGVLHCDNIRGRLDDHLGVFPDEVTWSHVAGASRVVEYLRLAAHAAGVGSGPES